MKKQWGGLMSGWISRSCIGLFLCVLSLNITAEQRIISLGGDVTEIVYALGLGDQLVARDTTSIYPDAAMQLPDVGYLRSLPLEGILSLRPDVVLLSDAARPAPLAERLTAAGIRVVSVPYQQDLDGIALKINTLAQALNREEEGQQLLQALDLQRQQLDRLQPLPDLKAVFILNHNGMGSPLVAGSPSSADTLIRISGVDNAIKGFQGYRPLTAEGMIAAQPRVVIMTESGVAAAGGEQGVWNFAGLRHAPAARLQQLVVVDDLAFLGFGPRTPAALLGLREALEQLQ